MEYEVLRQFINEGILYIDKENYELLKSQYTKEDIVETLTALITCGEVKFPLAEINYDDVIVTQKKLMKLETSIKKGNLYSRYEKTFGNYYFDESSSYNLVSNYFHQKERMNVAGPRYLAPTKLWKKFSSVKSIIRGILNSSETSINPAVLRSFISKRSYVASQFKPSVAKAIYDYFEGENIIDLCAGWGDRLAGFYASKKGKSYFGIDPNTTITNNYKRQIECYETICHKEAEVICGCAEDDSVVYPKSDLIFTSPPYFNTERYSEDSTQSYIKYQKLQIWLESFLFKSIKKSFDSLCKSGHLILNISDVYSDGQILSICEPMIKYAEELGFKHVDTFGMRMTKRMNSTIEGTGIFCEPIYIFEK